VDPRRHEVAVTAWRARRIAAWSAALLGGAAALVSAAAAHYEVTPARFLEQSARVAAAPILAVAYRADMDEVRRRTESYLRGTPGALNWESIADAVPGYRISARVQPVAELHVPPFVFESPDAPYLVRFRERFDLPAVIAGAATEYEALLALGSWVGSQFDHGTDPVIGGDKACDPTGLVEAGRAGDAYWCEIAARTMVHAATALGFPARVITASRDGYTWEHAVAEVWSNEFQKWFVIDTDFNHVYEHQGRPLSAGELMQHGAEWQRSGELRVRQIAPEKPNIPRGGNTIDLYRYVHVDMRNDWCSRPLRRGSPAGGDRATWWTAARDFPPLLTAKTRAERPDQLDWAMNEVAFTPTAAERGRAGARLVVALSAYSPSFRGFEIRSPGGAWTALEGATVPLEPSVGTTTLEARVRTRSGFPGPTYKLHVNVVPDTNYVPASTAMRTR
jgi:hypothetical protein